MGTEECRVQSRCLTAVLGSYDYHAGVMSSSHICSKLIKWQCLALRKSRFIGECVLKRMAEGTYVHPGTFPSRWGEWVNKWVRKQQSERPESCWRPGRGKVVVPTEHCQEETRFQPWITQLTHPIHQATFCLGHTPKCLDNRDQMHENATTSILFWGLIYKFTGDHSNLCIILCEGK